MEVEKPHNERRVMRGFRRGGGQGRGLGRGRPNCQRMGERGPFRDGTGPNPDCPKKKNKDEQQEERNDSGRALRRDGTGPNKDGQGPRESDLGPREECPKK